MLFAKQASDITDFSKNFQVFCISMSLDLEGPGSFAQIPGLIFGTCVLQVLGLEY